MKAPQNFIALIILLLASNPSWAKDDNYGAVDTPMKFVLAGNGGNCSGCEWTSAIGVIDQSTPGKFEEYYKKNPYPITVMLHSPGGNLMAGMELGRIFRKYKIPVDIAETQKETDPENHFEKTAPGICASACAYAFLGGVSRLIENGSRIGFHQFYGNPKTVEANTGSVSVEGYTLSADQIISGVIAEYIAEMGVDERVLSIASIAGKNDVITPNAKDLEILKVITNNDIGSLQIELFGNGIGAYRKYSSDEILDVRKISTYCIGSQKQAIVEFDSDESGGDATTMLSMINKIGFSIEGQQADDSIPKSNVLIKTSDHLRILVALPDNLRQRALNSDGFSVKIDSAHAFLNFGATAYFSLKQPDEKQMIHLAWSNCT